MRTFHTTGIYKIENLINHKCYIGQSVKIEQRWKNHKITAKNLNDKNYDNPLYRAIRKYGIENFSFEIIEECSVNELNNRQRYWIKHYDSFFNGYNLTMGGDGSGSKEKKISIIGIITDLENTNLTQKKIAEKWNMSEEMVQGINTGRYWKYDRQYPIRKSKFKPEGGKQIYYCIDCNKVISKGAKRCLECERKNRLIPFEEMKITREHLKDLIRTKSFTQIGKDYNVSDNAVRKWCDKFELPRKKSEIKKYTDEQWENI